LLGKKVLFIAAATTFALPYGSLALAQAKGKKQLGPRRRLRRSTRLGALPVTGRMDAGTAPLRQRSIPSREISTTRNGRHR
jgi:hypothetical protein